MSRVKGTFKNRVVAGAAALIITAVPVAPMIGVMTAHADSPSAYETLTSFSGYPGVTLTVSGGNYSKGETISVVAMQNNTAVATATGTATINGEFSVNVVLPKKLAQGAVTIMATGTQSGLQATNNYYVNPFNPSLSTDNGSSTPYGLVTVSGSGYAPNELVNLNFAGSVTSATADANGSFKGIQVTTPQVKADSYQLIGIGQDSGAQAVAYQYINGFYPSAAPSSYYVMPAGSLGFNGNGFAPNETVTVSDVTSGTVLSSFKTAGDGSFKNAGTFTVPASYAGQSIKVALSGATSGASTAVTTTIGQYYPNVVPSVYYVLPGQAVSVSGSGFMPGEAVDVYSGTTKVATVAADSYGNVAAATNSIVAPTNAAGTSLNLTLSGETSHGTGTVGVQVGSYNPQASPSDYYAMPGSQLTFSGSGYAPNETISVYSGQDTTSLTTIKTDATGSFMSAGAVSIAYSQAGGSASYRLVGADSKAASNVSIGIGQLSTQLTPSTYYVLPFQNFSVTASGFAPGEMVTLSDLSDTLPNFAAPVKANAKGTAVFTNLSVPATGKTAFAFKAYGQTSQASASASIGLGSYNPSVTLSNYYVRPGETVTVTGSGFAPNEVVTVSAGATQQTVTADKDGNASADIVVPFGNAKNSLDVTMTGVNTEASATTTMTLAPFSVSVTPSTWYSQPGTPVSFTGNGFVAGEKITMNLNGNDVATVQADAKGNVSVPASALPFAKAANYSFTGMTSGAVSTVSVGLAQFYAGVQLDSYYGNGGSSVTASGSGFVPNEVVSLMAGKTVLGSVTADAKGAFSKAVTIPYSAPTTLAITASGALSGAVATTSYTVAQVYSSVELGSYAAPAGSNLTFIGSGYLPNEPITVNAGRAGNYSFVAGANGSFTDKGFALPAGTTPGELTLTIMGTHSFTTSKITIWVQG